MPARASNKVYVVGNVAFVAWPAGHGLWLRTDTSVACTACTYCGALIYEPCRRVVNGKPINMWSGSTHIDRRRAAGRWRNKQPGVTITSVITPERARVRRRRT